MDLQWSRHFNCRLSAWNWVTSQSVGRCRNYNICDLYMCFPHLNGSKVMGQITIINKTFTFWTDWVANALLEVWKAQTPPDAGFHPRWCPARPPLILILSSLPACSWVIVPSVLSWASEMQAQSDSGQLTDLAIAQHRAKEIRAVSMSQYLWTWLYLM